jgi:hypothetical protein
MCLHTDTCWCASLLLCTVPGSCLDYTLPHTPVKFRSQFHFMQSVQFRKWCQQQWMSTVTATCTETNEYYKLFKPNLQSIKLNDDWSSPTLNSPYFEVSVNEAFSPILCQPHIHKRNYEYNSKLFVLILSQINPVQFLPLYFFMTHFNATRHPLLSSKQPAIFR